MVVKKRIVKSKKKSQKKVQQRRSRKKTSKRVSKRRSQRRSRKRVSKKKSSKRSLKVRRSRTKSQKKLIVRRKNSRRRKGNNKKQRGGGANGAYDSNFLRGSGKHKKKVKPSEKSGWKVPNDEYSGSRKKTLAALVKQSAAHADVAAVEYDGALAEHEAKSKGPNKRRPHAFKVKREVGVKLSQISRGLTALAGPALYYGGWYLVNKLDIYIPGLGRTLGLISMGMALQTTGITNTLGVMRGQISSVAIESIHSLSNAAIGRIYRTSRATNKIIKVIGNRITASKRALMGLNPDTSLYLRFKPEDSVGPHGETLVAVDVAETNTRFVPIPGKFMIDGAGNLVQAEVLVTRPNIHVKYVPRRALPPSSSPRGEDDFAPAAMELADAPAPAAAEESEIHLTTIVNPKEEEALFAMAKSAILDQPEPATAAAAAATVELDEERAEALAANLGLDTYMKEYIEGNMDQVADSVKEGRTLDLNGVVLEVLEAIKQVQEAARHYSEEDFAFGTPRSGGPTGDQSQDL
jgi:hypothetical protein